MMRRDKKPWRILMFAPAFAPHIASASLNNSKVALAMVRRGWKVDIISDRYEGFAYNTMWVEPWIALKQFTYQVDHEAGTLQSRLVQRVIRSIRLGHPIPGVRWANDALKQGLQLHAREPYDFVVSRFLLECAHLPALAFVRKTGIPWLACWNDPPAHLFPPPYKNNIPFLQRIILQRYVEAVAARATVNIFPSRRLAQYMMERAFHSVSWSRVKDIPHMGFVGFRARPHEYDNVFRLCHAGNLSAEREPRNLLRALRELVVSENAASAVRLDIIGVEDVAMKATIREYDLCGNVRFTGALAYSETLEKLMASDILVVVEAPCRTGIFLPGKLADYVQVCRPILSLSPMEGTISDLISTHGGGLTVDCRSTTAILEALRELYRKWQNRSLESYLSPSLNYLLSPEAVLDEYDRLFDGLASER